MENIIRKNVPTFHWWFSFFEPKPLYSIEDKVMNAFHKKGQVSDRNLCEIVVTKGKRGQSG